MSALLACPCAHPRRGNEPSPRRLPRHGSARQGIGLTRARAAGVHACATKGGNFLQPPPGPISMGVWDLNGVASRIVNLPLLLGALSTTTITTPLSLISAHLAVHVVCRRKRKARASATALSFFSHGNGPAHAPLPTVERLHSHTHFVPTARHANKAPRHAQRSGSTRKGQKSLLRPCVGLGTIYFTPRKHIALRPQERLHVHASVSLPVLCMRGTSAGAIFPRPGCACIFGVAAWSDHKAFGCSTRRTMHVLPPQTHPTKPRNT